MKPRTRRKLRNPVKYLRELSVVVVGIAITFTASDWISRRNEKRDMQRYLTAVKIELAENLKTIEEKGEYYEDMSRLGHYLRTNKREDLHTDSILKYSGDYGVGYIFSMNYKNSAYEMLKISGALRLIQDKMLLNSIMECYAKMEDLKYGSDMYINKKSDELFNAMLNSTSYNNLLAPENERMLSFLLISFDIDGLFDECSDQIKNTLALFPDTN